LANSGAYDIQFVFQSLVGSVFANVNAAPPNITGAMIYRVASSSGGAAQGPITTLSGPVGGNFYVDTYATIVGNYYAIEVVGTASTSQETRFSGQISAVPAPAVLGLVGIGLFGLGLARKARRA
jgi:hypothetical protein